MNPMAGDGHGRWRERGKAGGSIGIRRLRAQFGGGSKLSGGGGSRNLGSCGGRIEEHGGRIEEHEGQIEVRGRRIGQAGFCMNSHGEHYAPDSEDEGSDGAPGVEVPADRAPGVRVPVDEAPIMELDPEVQACMELVLATIDPVYHAVFISMYKVMVPAFFKSN